MKFGGIFFICVLILFISFPLFDAFVTCPYGRTDLILKGEKGETNCTTSCAVYSCVGKVNNGSFELHDVGCTEDFFRDCAFFHDAIDFVNATSPYEMKYFNDNVMYVSGCSTERNGRDCILKKSSNFVKEILTTFILSPPPSSRLPESTVASTSKPVNDSTTSDLKKDATTVTSDPAPGPSSDTTTPGGKNASNGQDKDFWKKIGCFAIGLIVAAWIY
uniref:Uncharacterized protein n=1 Tax=Panagrolaimus davidi TaxID=227884 RepID=A0A914PJL9_9BILA